MTEQAGEPSLLTLAVGDKVWSTMRAIDGVVVEGTVTAVLTLESFRYLVEFDVPDDSDHPDLVEVYPDDHFTIHKTRDGAFSVALAQMAELFAFVKKGYERLKACQATFS